MAEVEKMTTDEIDGLVNMWPEDPNLPEPDGPIEDYMVHVAQNAMAVVQPDQEVDVAGPPSVIVVRLLIKFFTGLFQSSAKCRAQSGQGHQSW
jgi:hypothetical protein